MVSSVARSDSGYLADLRAQPPEDPANLLRFPRAQERELGRLLADCGGLDVDRLVARAGSEHRALDLAPLILGDGQDVMMADRRVVGEAKDPLDLGRAQHLPERLLNSLLEAADLPPQSGEPAAGGVEDRTTTIKAPLDRAERRPRIRPPPRGGRRVAETGCRRVTSHRSRLPMARRVSTVSASASGSSTPPVLTAADMMPNVMQAAEGGSQAGAECFGHLGREALAAVNLAGVAAGLHAQGGGLAERAGGTCRDERFDLVEIEQLERVRVHHRAQFGPIAALAATLVRSGSFRRAGAAAGFAVRSVLQLAPPVGRIDSVVFADDRPQRFQALVTDRRVVVVHSIDQDLQDSRLARFQAADRLDGGDAAILELDRSS